MNRGRQWLAVLVLFLVASTASAQTQFPLGGNGWMGLGNRNGDFFIVQDDLQVKVPGGYVRINRDFDGKQWVFNRQWSGLGRPSYNKAMYPSIGAFYSCTVVDGVSSCDTTASSGNSIQFGNPENDVQQTRIPNDPYFGRNADGSAASDPHADQFVARMGVGFTRSSDGTSWVSSKHPRFVLRPQQVPALPVSAGPDAHPSTGRPGKGGIATTPVNGFRWTDRSGAWIEYDNFGRITSYGDRNDVRVWMQYGSHGQVERVLDDNGRTVFTLLYTGGSADFVSEVRDHTPIDGSIRRVQYHYDGDGRLRNVIDARGNTTSFDYGSLDSIAYDYDGSFGAPDTGGSGEPINARATTTSAATGFVVDTRRKVTKVTDAEGRVTEISYGVTARVGRIKAPDGGVIDLDYGYDKLKKEFSMTARYPQTSSGRKVETVRFDQEGRLVYREVNGKALMMASGDRKSMTYTDELGSSMQVQRDNFDKVTRRANSDGTAISISYDSASTDIKEVLDEMGVAARFEYNNRGNLLKVTRAAGRTEEQVTEYEVNTRGESELIRLKGGVSQDGVLEPDVELRLTYDANGNPRELIDGEGKAWKYEYDALGNLLKATDPLNHEWTYTYDAHGNRLAATDPNHLTTHFSYDKNDRLLTATDPRGKVRSLEYDGLGRPRRVVDQTGSSYTQEYDLAGRLLSATDSVGQSESFAYDAADRPVSVTDGEGNVVGFDYAEADGSDRGGNLIGRVNYPTLQRLIRYNGRREMTLQAFMVDGEGEARNYAVEYDSRGDLRSITNPYKKVTTNEFDSLRRRVSTTDEEGRTARFGYDRRGNLTSVTDPLGHVTRLEYDRRNKLVKETNAAGEATHFEYDDAGRRSVLRRPNGVRITYEYDPGGRLVLRQSYRSDSSLELTDRFTWDDASRLTAWSTSNASSTLAYDDAGRLLSETVAVDGVSLSRAYTYYPNGQRKTYTGPDGVTVAYSYDGNGQLSRADLPGEGSISITERQWTAAKKTVLPGGTVREIERNGLLSPTHLRIKSPAQAVLFDQQIAYGKREELISRTTQGQRIDYAYDDALRLLKADPAGWSGTAETFTVDAANNRLSDNRVSSTWQYDDANRLTQRGDVSYQYDAAGNLIRKTDASLGEPRRTTQYAYDGYNRLIEVRDGAEQVVARYAYDPFGYRLSKEVTATGAAGSGATAGKLIFLQAEEGLLAEVAADGRVLRTYGWQPGLPYSTSPLFLRTNSSFYYYHNDQLGTPWLLTDRDGSVVWSVSRISAFGEFALITSNFVEQPWRFPGQYYDAETGLNYNLHRYYDAATGRYITTDPIGLAGGLNAYAYVAASPLNYRDPNGLLLDTVADVGFILYDVYRILKDNVFGDCDNLGENLAALGLDVVGAAVPFLTGLGTASRAARAADDVAEAAGRGADDLADAGRGADDAADAAEDASKGADDVADAAEDAANGSDGVPGKHGDESNPKPPRTGPDNPPDPNDFTNPDSIPDGWEWRGKGEPGSRDGAYHNPDTKESLHDDRTHPEGKPGHWTYTDSQGTRWDNYGDGWTPQPPKGKR